MRSVLFVHNEAGLLEGTLQVFAARGFGVAVVPTIEAAKAWLDDQPNVSAIIVRWDLEHGDGEALYEWALTNRPEWRGRFVFVGREAPSHFDAVVRGRCVHIEPTEIEEMVRIVETTASRIARQSSQGLDEFEIEWIDAGQPTLLLVDDEPLQLAYMSRFLTDLGFVVTSAESGNAAAALLEVAEFQVILCDWFMPDGSGAAFYDWVIAHQPEVARRCIFMSGSLVDDFAECAPGRTLFPKGQDSPALVQLLLATARLP